MKDDRSWKGPQEWIVKVRHYFGEQKDRRDYSCKSRDEAVCLAESLARDPYWDWVMIFQVDILRRPSKTSKGKDRAKKLSAKERTLPLFKETGE